MPYLDKSRRRQLDLGKPAEKPGDLNYLVHRECFAYVEKNGLSYQTINDIIGALECVQQEFYRLLAAPYEDVKRSTNGDVGYSEALQPDKENRERHSASLSPS